MVNNRIALNSDFDGKSKTGRNPHNIPERSGYYANLNNIALLDQIELFPRECMIAASKNLYRARRNTVTTFQV